VDLNTVKSSSITRIKESPTFTAIKTNAQWLGAQNDKEYSLKPGKVQEGTERN
jgi:hypothetical protein